VLDNLTDQVLPIDKAKIRIRKIASADPKIWVGNQHRTAVTRLRDRNRG